MKVIYYRQDLVPLLQSSIQCCRSIFFDFGHINATVIRNIMLVHTPHYIESQAWKKYTKDTDMRWRFSIKFNRHTSHCLPGQRWSKHDMYHSGSKYTYNHCIPPAALEREQITEENKWKPGFTPIWRFGTIDFERETVSFDGAEAVLL